MKLHLEFLLLTFPLAAQLSLNSPKDAVFATLDQLSFRNKGHIFKVDRTFPFP